jgi:putative effector of murein hydrolase
MFFYCFDIKIKKFKKGIILIYFQLKYTFKKHIVPFYQAHTLSDQKVQIITSRMNASLYNCNKKILLKNILYKNDINLKVQVVR